MKWHNTRLDKLPKDRQEVLISVEGINYVAVYDANTKVFTVSADQTGRKEKKYKADLHGLYWTEYKRPGK